MIPHLPRTSALVVLLAASGATVSCRQIAGLHPVPMPCSDPMMIDDMEDGTPTICASQGRSGGWYKVPDGTPGAVYALNANETIPGGRDSSQHAVHFTGSGFTDWGAIAAFDLNHQDASNQVYNADAYAGLTFWMKSTVPVTLQVLTPPTVPMAYGQQCVAGSSPNCNNPFAFQITAPPNAWTEYWVPYAALRQLQNGTATWNPSQLIAVQFLVGPGANFDVWIDDIAFYASCTDPGCIPIPCTGPNTMACAAKGTQPAGCYPTGTDCQAIDTWCSDPLLIDDMEDGDNHICPTGGRTGTWWTASDGSSTDLTPATGAIFEQAAIPGGRGTSHEAAHLKGSGFSSWALMAFDLAGGNGQTFDASADDGIAFWAKTNTTGFNFEINSPATIPASRGGSCVDTDTALNCDKSWWVWVDTPASDTWFQVRVPFAALKQMPGVSATTNNLVPGSATWDPSQLVNVQAAVGAGFFDLWIDDIAFYKCTGSACDPTCTDPALPVLCPAVGGLLASCWPAGKDCSARLPARNADVWGSGPNDVWIVGYAGAGLSEGTAFHWDGSRWTSSDVGAVNDFWGVSGQGTDDVWAVLDHGGVERWNGSSWLLTSAGTDTSLTNVWVAGPDDVWVAAYPGTLLHWDGSGWSTEFSVAKWMIGLWGTAPNNIWAVGDGGTILHYDGAAWSPVSSPTTVFLNRVWGTGPSDVWAVGDSGPVLHFDGSTWAPSPGVTGGFLGVWASGPADAWAVGYGGGIAHWDGTTWSAVTSPTTADLYAVWGSGPSDVWAVGDGTNVLHFDGVTWSSVTLAN
jgi:hypothetical protein